MCQTRSVRTPLRLLAILLFALAVAAPAAAADDIRWDRTWGLNVDAVAPSTGPEVCTVRASCQFGGGGGTGGAVMPQGLAVGPTNGHVYVTEYAGHRVQEFDADGAFVRMWGRDVETGGSTGFEVCTVAASCKNGASGAAGGEFNLPYGIATDAAGHVYVADQFNNRIQEFTATGGFVRAWGRDVSTAAAGTGLEICTQPADCKTALVTSTASGGGQGGFLAFPAGIAVDGNGFVYVANQSGRRIERFTPQATFDRAWGQGVISGGNTPEICTVASSCTAGGSSGGVGGNVGLPIGLAVDGAANVYVFEAIGYRMEKFTSEGTWLRTWGKNVDAVAPGTGFEVCTVSADCKAGETGTAGGEFLNPSAGPNAPASNAVAVDAAGTVYVTDRESARVQAFSSGGGFLRAWGTDVNALDEPGGGYQNCTVASHCLPGTSDGLGGGMDAPSGIAATPGGTVYVGDQTGKRVQAFTPCSGASVVGLSSAAYAVDEGDGAVRVTLQRTGDPSCAATVTLTTAAGSATSGDDFTPVTITVTIPAGATSATVDVPVVDDAAQEGDGAFGVTLSAPGPGVTLGSPASATVTIADDDAPETVRFSTASRAVPEAGGPVTLTIERVGDGRGRFSVRYATRDDTAVAGSDYAPTDGTLAFADGETRRTIEVSILDDGTPEEEERFTAALSAPTGNVSVGSPGTTTVAITSEDLIDTVILSGPADPLRAATASLAFEAVGASAGVTFECWVDGAAPAPCASPHGVGPLGEGAHTISVRASAPGGIVDPSPARVSFTVVAPDTQIISGPDGPTSSTVVYAFTSDVPGATFECRLDGAAFAPCTSPYLPVVRDGSFHRFEVRAVTADGLRDASPAARSFAETLSSFSLGCDSTIVRGQEGAARVTCSAVRIGLVCPVGSQCDVTFDLAVFERDTAITTSAVIRYQLGDGTPERKLLCESDVSVKPAGHPPCPQQVRTSVLGTGAPILATCGNHDDERRGPGAQPGPSGPEISCRVTGNIRAARPLAVVATGSEAAISVPSPGTLTVASDGRAAGKGGRAAAPTNLDASPLVTRPAFAAAPSKKKKKKRAVPLVKPLVIKVRKAGRVALPLGLSAAAKATLRKRGTLKLPLVVTFKPTSGKRTVSGQTITLTREG